MHASGYLRKICNDILLIAEPSKQIGFFSAGMVAHPVAPSNGELAAVGYSGSVYGFLVLLGVFLHQRRNGEEIRPLTDIGNESEAVSYTHLTLPTIYSV